MSEKKIEVHNGEWALQKIPLTPANSFLYFNIDFLTFWNFLNEHRQL